MAPGPPSKRKRDNDEGGGGAGGGRPSPHRPHSLGLASHSSDSPGRSQAPRGRGSGGPGARRGRGGRTGTVSNRETFSTSRSQAPPTEPATASTPTPTPQDSFRQPPPTSSTQQAPIAPAPPPPEIPQPPSEPLQPPTAHSYYFYEVLTEERLGTWEASGRQQVIEHAVEAFAEDDYIKLSITFQEIIQGGMYGKVDPQEAGRLVKDILASAPEDDPLEAASAFLDVFDSHAEIFEWKASSFDWKNAKSFPEIAYLRNILSFSEISLELIREVLDGQLLEALGLVRQKAFKGTFIRKQTDVLYKTGNFNLLREESEGYAKLMIELLTTLSCANPKDHQWSYKLVKPLLGNISALVGAFRLDAARTLDVILDILASNIVAPGRFIAKFIRLSPYWPSERTYSLPELEPRGLDGLPLWAYPEHEGWFLTPEQEEMFSLWKKGRDTRFWDRLREVGMDAFFELGRRRLLGPEEMLAKLSAEQVNDGRFEASRSWIETTKTLPPAGNEVAAQLLGFKLRYHASNRQESVEAAENNIINLAALLIKIGFVSLRDLYPHIFPSDGDMEEARQKQEKVKEQYDAAQSGSGAMNALAMAAALPEDDVPPSNSLGLRPKPALAATRASTPKPDASSQATNNESDKAIEPVDQKMQLLRQLLLIGALPEALYILGRFPWMISLYPDMPEYLHRIMHYAISELYEQCIATSGRDTLTKMAPHAVSDPASATRGIKMIKDYPRARLRWPKLERSEADGRDYRYYWDDWTDGVPVCHTVDDLFSFFNTFVNLSGVKIGQDATLLTKFARIGKFSLQQDFSKANQGRWIELCKRLLVPALSLTKSDTPVVNEVWEILKMFPTKTRYNIYAEWYSGPTSRNADVAAAMKATEKKAKSVLKLISADRESTRGVARQLAKVASSSPGRVFESSIRQLESYQNMITLFVEGGRYYTFLGYDVLAWTLLTSLAKDRARIASTGLTISPWLQALSDLAAQLFRRYNHMNPLPTLQYVLVQLEQGITPNMRVLQEMIEQMAGIAMNVEYNDKQLMALAGGPELRKLIHLEARDRRYDSKSTAKRLLKVLVDNYLAGPYLVAIAQQRQSSVSNAEQDSLKLISENFDDMHQGLLQYYDFLVSNLSMKEFAAIVPSIASMLKDYGIESSVVFTLHRKNLSEELRSFDETHSAGSKPQLSITNGNTVNGQVNGDIEMQDAVENDAAKPDSEGIADVAMEDVPDVPVVDDVSAPWHPILANLMSDIAPLVPEVIEQKMSLPFFVTFWQLSLEDVIAPSMAYDEATKKIESRMMALKRDRKDMSVAAVKRREQDEKELQTQLDALREEMGAHIKNYLAVKKRLGKEKDHWFPGFHGKHDTLNAALLQQCFLPRIVLSPHDASFCFRMLMILHERQTPGFATMHFLDKLFTDKILTSLIFQFTGREAENFGRFLAETLKMLSAWHKNKSEYATGALGNKRQLIGFARSFKDGKPEMLMEYEDFRVLLYKWHNNIYGAFKACLKPGDEYMHIHNALKILKCIAPYYPKVNFHGKNLLETLENLAKEEAPADRQNKKQPGEGRQDLSVLTNSVMASIKPQSKTWVFPIEFRSGTAPPKDMKAPEPRPSSSTPKPPTAEASRQPPPMNPRADAFKPRLDTNVRSDGKVSKEDGEITATPQAEAAIDTTADATRQDRTESIAATKKPADGLRPSRGSSPAPGPRGTGRPAVPVSGRATPVAPQTRSDDRPAPPSRLDGTRTSHAAPEGPMRRPPIPRDINDTRERRERPFDSRQPPAATAAAARGAETIRHERQPDWIHEPYVDDRGRGATRDLRSAGRDQAQERYARSGPPRADVSEPPPRASSRADAIKAPSQPAASGQDLSAMNPERAAAFMNDRGSEQYAGQDRPRRFPSPPRTDARLGTHAVAMEASRELRGRGPATRAEPYQPRGDYPRDMASNGARGPNPPPQRMDPYDRHERGMRSDLMGPPARPGDRAHPEFAPRPIPRHQDPNYGRLNQDSPTSPPQQNARANRASEQGRGSATPTGRRSETFAGQSPVGPSTPSTPSSDTGGVHPSRLQQIEPAQAPHPRGGPAQGPMGGPAMAPSGPRSSRGVGPPMNTRGGPPVGEGLDRRVDQRKSNRLQENQGPYGGDGQGAFPPATRNGAPLEPLANDRGTSIRGRASLPSGPLANGSAQERYDEPNRGPPRRDGRQQRPGERYDDSGAYHEGPPMSMPPQGAQGPPRRDYAGGRRGGPGFDDPSRYQMQGGGPPVGPPGGGRREGGGYGQLGGAPNAFQPQGPEAGGRRDMMSGSRKRSWTGEGPGGADEKRPRRSGR